MIALHSVTKSFGAVRALLGVTLAAPDGVVTGLLGENGAGKTTALRVACGLLHPDSGDAHINGVRVTPEAVQLRRDVGVLPHQPGLWPRLTPREHVHYYGRLNGVASEVIERRTQDIFTMLEMNAYADRRTDGFSQGQKLKVALARALVHAPQNIVLDEPTAGLDVMSTRAVRALIRRLRDEGRCVLFSSHVMQEVAAVCERVVVIHGGSVRAAGTLAEIMEQTGAPTLEDAFVKLIGGAAPSASGVAAAAGAA